MSKFDEFKSTLENGIGDLAEDTLKEFKDDAINDGKDFLRETDEDLRRWTSQLAAGELSQDEFKWLVQGKKDLAELKALKQKGLALAETDKFRAGLITLVTNTALDVFPQQ